MPLRFFNTYSRALEEFHPLDEANRAVKMYTCGPTVYSFAHIGNFRTFVFQDVLRRYLKQRGLQLTHAMNLTDVDDRIIANAAAAGVGIREYTEKFAQAFFADCKAQSVEAPEHWIRATDHIPDMVKLIERLQKKSFTYDSDGSIYCALQTGQAIACAGRSPATPKHFQRRVQKVIRPTSCPLRG